MRLLLPFLHLLLYGNFWIALGALSLCWQTTVIFFGDARVDALAGFVFLGTLCLYAVHRLVGMSKAHADFQENRYRVITKYKRHIQWYALMGGLGAAVCLLFLKRETQLAVVLPALVSAGYVLPVLGNQKRLRDLDDLKIFLVAVVWAWITVLLPILEYDLDHLNIALPCFLERILFVFAITLPFDIRDLKVDGATHVKTIPGRIGIGWSKALAVVLILLAGGLAWYNWQWFYYTPFQFLAIVVMYFFTILLLLMTNGQRNDYFFTGWMDGTMVLMGIAVWVVS